MPGMWLFLFDYVRYIRLCTNVCLCFWLRHLQPHCTGFTGGKASSGFVCHLILLTSWWSCVRFPNEITRAPRVPPQVIITESHSKAINVPLLATSKWLCMLRRGRLKEGAFPPHFYTSCFTFLKGAGCAEPGSARVYSAVMNCKQENIALK